MQRGLMRWLAIGLLGFALGLGSIYAIQATNSPVPLLVADPGSGTGEGG